MSTYLLIDFLIIILPLIVSFFPDLSYYKKFPYVLVSIFAGGLFFVSWDIIATLRGDWSFNPEYVMGISFAGLPLEELLFFLFVPYSLLLVYEQAAYILKDRTVPWKQGAGYATGMMLILVSFLFTGKNYSFIAIFSAGIVFLGMSLFFAGIMVRLAFWAYLISGFLLFILFNYFLTSLPVVIYSPSAVSGVRFLTIPLEDFFYNFTMMAVYLAFYLWAKDNYGTRKNFRILSG
ncbi:MAG: lycopene cyclase domain-containing protein [Methanoregulaceae archaeon]|nr:MAG: lycopene cyclase domain-containing protein [Methanoregulaceae archaeon]